MRGPEHVSIGVVTTGGVLWLANGQSDLGAYALIAVSFAAVGSLVPDIDHPRAWISNRIPAALLAGGITALGTYKYLDWTASRGDSSGMATALAVPFMNAMQPFLLLAWLAIAAGASLLCISVAMSKLVEHRGPTHSLTVGLTLAAAVALAVAVAGAPWTLGLWFGWGFLTHLLADMTTKMGCSSILWPVGAELGAQSGVRSPAITPVTPSAPEPILVSPATSEVPRGEQVP